MFLGRDVEVHLPAAMADIFKGDGLRVYAYITSIWQTIYMLQ